MLNDLATMQKKDSEIAESLGIQIDIYRSLRYSLFPDTSIPDYAFGLYMAACLAKNYDPLKKPYHVVMMTRNVEKDRKKEPIWEKYPVIMPGIISYRIDAIRTGTFHGISDVEFGVIISEKLGGVEVKYPEWARIIIYKKIGNEVISIPAKLYWKECYATTKKDTDAPNDMWKKRPRAQLEKCCEALAYRKGFPEETGAIPTMEEMEGRNSIDELPGEKDITPETGKPEQHPLSQSFTVDEDIIRIHAMAIENCKDWEELKQVYIDAKAATKGDREASNKISKLTKERQDYIKQLNNPAPTEIEKEVKRDEFWSEYNGDKK